MGGKVWAWGSNEQGQLGRAGRGSSPGFPSPVSGLPSPTAVSSSSGTAFAIQCDGSVLAWGNNRYGQRGDDLRADIDTPLEVHGLAQVVQIACRGGGAYALTSDGSVLGWGQRQPGLRDYIGDYLWAPDDVWMPQDWHFPNGSEIVAIAAGDRSIYALGDNGTVLCRGASNQFGQLGDGGFDQSLQGITALAAGSYSAYALSDDGTVSAWGLNQFGQLGDGTNANSSTPVRVGTLTDVIAIASGQDTAYAVRDDGTVWAWGSGAGGQLGNADSALQQSAVPVQVADLRGVTSVAAFADSAYALKTDGTVWAWGYNGDGDLGDGTTVHRPWPVQVRGLTGITSIASGGDSAYAIEGGVSVQLEAAPASLRPRVAAPPKTSDQVGSVWAWGENSQGLLVRPDEGRPSPVQVSDLSHVTQVFAGNESAQALRSDGTVLVWGRNSGDAFSLGSEHIVYLPAQAKGLTEVMAICVDWAPGHAASDYSAFVVSSKDGSVRAWGHNRHGQLGDGTSEPRSSPSPVKVRTRRRSIFGNTSETEEPLTSITGIAAYGGSAFAVKADGTVWAWGLNTRGQLGDGGSDSRSLPVQVGGLTGVCRVVAGAASTYAVKRDGTVWAWGTNHHGQLGDGTLESRSTPVQIAGLGEVIAVAASQDVPAGKHSTFALKSDGTVWAWGNNDSGRLSTGSQDGKVTIPVPVDRVDRVVGIAAGKDFALALKDDGTVWFWGLVWSGGRGTWHKQPFKIDGLDGVVEIAAARGAFYSRKADGTVWAWRANKDGVLGNGDAPFRLKPAPIEALGGASAMFASCYSAFATKPDGSLTVWGRRNWLDAGTPPSPDGDDAPISLDEPTHTVDAAATQGCSFVASRDGTVWAWGENHGQRLGVDSDATYVDRPARVVGLSGVTAVATMDTISLALREDGHVLEWGTFQGRSGQTPAPPRRVVGVSGIVAIGTTSNSGTAYALSSDGAVWVWGSNEHGEFGNGKQQTWHERMSEPPQLPVRISSIQGVTAIATGYASAYALTSDGTVWAWGENYAGELGDGTQVDRSTPTQIVGLSDIVAIAAGYHSAFAVGADGTVWAWGSNSKGVLGDGTQLQRLAPVRIDGLSGVVSVTCAVGTTFALRVEPFRGGA